MGRSDDGRAAPGALGTPLEKHLDHTVGVFFGADQDHARSVEPDRTQAAVAVVGAELTRRPGRTDHPLALNPSCDQASVNRMLGKEVPDGRLVLSSEHARLCVPDHLGTYPTVIWAGPLDAPESVISAASRIASSIRTSTICDSGTVLITSPLTKI